MTFCTIWWRLYHIISDWHHTLLLTFKAFHCCAIKSVLCIDVPCDRKSSKTYFTVLWIFHMYKLNLLNLLNSWRWKYISWFLFFFFNKSPKIRFKKSSFLLNAITKQCVPIESIVIMKPYSVASSFLLTMKHWNATGCFPTQKKIVYSWS